MVATGQVVTGGGAPHTHGWSEVTGEPDFALAADLTSGLAAKADQEDLEALDAATSTALAGKASTGHSHDFASTASVAALDTRVDALEVAPPAHTHPWADITGEPTFALASDLTSGLGALDTRVDALEAEPAPAWPILVQTGGTGPYTAAPDARIYVGEDDPGAVAEGSVWIGPDA